MNHRVKNSLMIVSSVLHLQAKDIDDANLTLHLDEASHRVAAVAKAHDQLYHGSDIERMDIGKYIEAICKDLQASVSQSTIHTDVKYGIEVSTDRAISSALIVNELITNAAKYANPDKSGGTIWVTVAPVGDDDFSISVRDEGVGLPPGFDLRKAKGLGMRIINSFSQQLNGTLTVRVQNPGTEFIVTIPRQSSAVTPDQN